MDKESIYELQKIDCSCNECGYLIRDIDKLKRINLELRKLHEDVFNLRKENLIREAKQLILTNKEKGEKNLKKSLILEFHYNNSPTPILYGNCSKFNKEISFIGGVLSIENQKCFVHRKDIIK